MASRDCSYSLILGYTKFMNYAKLWERIRIQRGCGVWTERDRWLLEKNIIAPVGRDGR